MTDAPRWERRLRVEIEIGKEIPSAETVERWDAAVRATPDATMPQPYDRVWVFRVRTQDPDGGSGSHVESSGALSSLSEILDGLRQQIPVVFTRAHAVEASPLDARLARLLGTPREPAPLDLAKRVANALELREPTTEPGCRLLVNLAISAQVYFDNPLRWLDATEVGYGLQQSAFEGLAPGEIDVALSDLSLPPKETDNVLCDQAVRLVELIGFRVT